MLVNCDNMVLMRNLLSHKDMAGGIDLIYIDPPFFSGSDYGSGIRLNSGKGRMSHAVRQTVYHDTWENGMEEYLAMLTVRFLMMKELLSERGSLFVHLDWHVMHYVKIILDEIFGEKNFINEIIWHYKSGGVSKRYYSRKHDTLLFYAKSAKYQFHPQTEKSYNRGFKPYRFKGVKEYRDELGWYTMVNMKDVWTIDMVGRTSAERTGYATQKPEALVSRIIAGCTNEGDLVADFFGGSGTLAAAAERMGRNWISCDKGRSASGKAAKRLAGMGASYCFYEPEVASTEENVEIDVGVASTEHEITGGMNVKIMIKDYVYKNYNDLPMDDKYKEMIKEASKHEPLQLLDYWSVDFDYDGLVFRPDEFLCRESGKLAMETSKEGFDYKCIAVRAVDLFGSSSFKVIRRTGEEWK